MTVQSASGWTRAWSSLIATRPRGRSANAARVQGRSSRPWKVETTGTWRPPGQLEVPAIDVTVDQVEVAGPLEDHARPSRRSSPSDRRRSRSAGAPRARSTTWSPGMLRIAAGERRHLVTAPMQLVDELRDDPFGAAVARWAGRPPAAERPGRSAAGDRRRAGRRSQSDDHLERAVLAQHLGAGQAAPAMEQQVAVASPTRSPVTTTLVMSLGRSGFSSVSWPSEASACRPEHRPDEHQRRARGPGLRRAGDRVGDRRAPSTARSKPQNSSGRRIGREVVGGGEQSAAERAADRVEAVAPSAGRRDRRVVRPDRAGVVADRVEAGLVRGERPDAPARRHRRGRRGLGDGRRVRLVDDAAPQAVAGVGAHRVDGALRRRRGPSRCSRSGRMNCSANRRLRATASDSSRSARSKSPRPRASRAIRRFASKT